MLGCGGVSESMKPRAGVFAMLVLAAGLLGDSCLVGEPGTSRVDIITNPDARCVDMIGTTQAIGFSPALPDLVWVTDQTAGEILAFDVTTTPPVLSEESTITLRSDNDGDGLPDLIPIALGALHFESQGTAEEPVLLAAGSGLNGVYPFHIPTGGPYRLLADLQATADADEALFVNLVEPPDTDFRTVISTQACIKVPAAPADNPATPGDERDVDGFPNSYDSTGVPIPSSCDDMRASFYATVTSGIALVGEFNGAPAPDGSSGARYFASTRNTFGVDQAFPGTVLVHDQPMAGGPIGPYSTPVVFTTGYNPSGIAARSVVIDGVARNFVLVATAGLLVPVADDPMTEDVVESGFVASADFPAAIEVIDADHPENGIIAVYPLGPAGLTRGLLIDPLQRIAVAGSGVGRNLYAVSLAALETMDYDPDAPPATPIQLTGGLLNGGAFPILKRASGSVDPAQCPGQVFGFAFNDAGDRLFAADYCDGVITEVGVEPSGSFSTKVAHLFFSRIDAEDPSALRGISGLALRPGAIDDAGMDAYALVFNEDGEMMCGIDLGANSGSL